MLSVCDSISDHILKEYFENSSGLLIDQSRDSLHSTSSCQTSDGRLGDALDIISQHLPVPLGSSLSESFSSFASSSHDWGWRFDASKLYDVIIPLWWDLYSYCERIRHNCFLFSQSITRQANQSDGIFNYLCMIVSGSNQEKWGLSLVNLTSDTSISSNMPSNSNHRNVK